MINRDVLFNGVVEKNLPHLNCQSAGIVITAKTDTEANRSKTQEYIGELDKYLRTFAATPDNTCPGCASHLGIRDATDLLSAALGLSTSGTFEYGIVFGEGNCSKCGWPARANHKTDLCEWVNIYPYHPDSLGGTHEDSISE